MAANASAVSTQHGEKLADEEEDRADDEGACSSTRQPRAS
jgi:hypothetical protein